MNILRIRIMAMLHIYFNIIFAQYFCYFITVKISKVGDLYIYIYILIL